MEEGIRVEYGNIAPNAKETFEANATNTIEFSGLQNLNKNNFTPINVGNPCELYSVPLDGTVGVFPTVPQKDDFGVWSEFVSDENGNFANPLVLTLESEENFTVPGLTFTFDTHNNIFCNKMSVEWYLNEELLASDEVLPDSAFYFYEKDVGIFNKIIVTFESLNMPYNRLKLNAIDYGHGMVFEGEEITYAKIMQTMNPISVQLNIGTCDLDINSKNEYNYKFQKKQPLKVFFNNKLRSAVYVESAERISKNGWRLKAEDAIGILEDTVFVGGLWTLSQNKKAVELIGEIFNAAKIPFEIEEGVFDDLDVVGFIPYGTCRNALQLVLFAIGGVADATQSESVKITKLKNEVTQHIGLERIYTGQKFTESKKVTGVQWQVHVYQTSTEAELETIYQAEQQNVGDTIVVDYKQPYYDLELIDCVALSANASHAIIIPNSTQCKIVGKKYKDTIMFKEKHIPNLLSNELKNVSIVKNATLRCGQNVDGIVDSLYEYQTNIYSTSMKIAERRHISGNDFIKYGTGLKYGSGIKYGQRAPREVSYDQAVNVGDWLEYDTEYYGTKQGRLIEQKYSIVGGMLAKEVVVK